MLLAVCVFCLWILCLKSELIPFVISDVSVHSLHTGLALRHHEEATIVEIAEFVKRVTDKMPIFIVDRRRDEIVEMDAIVEMEEIMETDEMKEM